MNTDLSTRYWCDRKIRMFCDGPTGPLDVTVDRPFALVGSHEKADIVVSAERIARRHLYLHAIDSGIYCVDLARGRKARKPVGGWLRSGQIIESGKLRIEVQFADGAPSHEEPKADLLLDKTGLHPALEMMWETKKGSTGKHLITRRLAIVGRGRACSCRFTTRSISDEHCVLYQHNGQLWIIDLKTAAGTRVDENVIQCALLDADSRVRIGRVKLGFQFVDDTNLAAGYARWNGEPEQTATIQPPSDASESGEPRTAAFSTTHSPTGGVIFEDVLSDDSSSEEALSESASSSADLSGDVLSDEALTDPIQAFDSRLAEIEQLRRETLTDLELRESQFAERLARQENRERELAELDECLRSLAGGADESEAEPSTAPLSPVDAVRQFVARLESAYRQKVELLEGQMRESRAELQCQLDDLARTRHELEARQADHDHGRAQWELDRQPADEALRDGLRQVEAERTELARRENAIQQEEVRSREQIQQAEVACKQSVEQAEQSLRDERSAFAEQQARWNKEKLQMESELDERAEQMRRDQHELALMQEKLATDRKEFERFESVEMTQRRMLANLNRLDRKQSALSGLGGWLFGWFRRSD